MRTILQMLQSIRKKHWKHTAEMFCQIMTVNKHNINDMPRRLCDVCVCDSVILATAAAYCWAERYIIITGTQCLQSELYRHCVLIAIPMTTFKRLNSQMICRRHPNNPEGTMHHVDTGTQSLTTVLASCMQHWRTTSIEWTSFMSWRVTTSKTTVIKTKQLIAPSYTIR